MTDLMKSKKLETIQTLVNDAEWMKAIDGLSQGSTGVDTWLTPEEALEFGLIDAIHNGGARG